MKQHPAIKELYRLIRTKDWSEFYPDKIREQALTMWIEKWVVPVKYKQSVIDTKYLTSEYSDLIKTKLAQEIAQELLEECIEVQMQDREISGEIVAIKREVK